MKSAESETKEDEKEDMKEPESEQQEDVVVPSDAFMKLKHDQPDYQKKEDDENKDENKDEDKKENEEEEVDGVKTVTIITSKKGKIKKEVCKGEEAEAKLKELENATAEPAKIEGETRTIKKTEKVVIEKK